MPDTSPSWFSRLWPWFAAALSGLLLALCFPPFKVGGLAFFALIPLLCAVWLKQPPRRAWWYRLRLGYVTGLVFFTITFSWLSELGPLFDSWFLHTLPFLLALYLALYPAAWAWFAGWIVGRHFAPAPPQDPTEPFVPPPLLLSTRNLVLSALIAAAWVALEWLRGWLFSGFSWNKLGVALYHPKTLALIQTVEFTGVGGLSFLLVLCNAIGLITILRLRAEIGRTRLRPHFDFSLTVALVVLSLVYGARLPFRERPGQTVPLRVVALQTNVPQRWKMTNTHDREIFERIARLHSVAVGLQPHLVLWPEAVVPGGMLADVDVQEFVLGLAQEVPALLLGTDDLARDHNSAAFLLRGQREPIFYDKRHLVPFGEYLPLRPLLGWALDDLVPGDFSPGAGPIVFDLPEPAVKLAPLICFEDTDPPIVREMVQLGAHVLVNLTNDGWFGQSAGAEQHLVNAVFRTVESRRPLIRCTNTGVTAFVDTFGRVERLVEPFTMAAVQHQIAVPTQLTTTFYTRHGEWFPVTCTGLAVLAMALRFGWQRRVSSASPAE